MQKIIKDNAVIEDTWFTLPKGHRGDLPEGKILIHLSYWLEHRACLDLESGNLGLWLDSEDAADEVGFTAKDFPIIAINFPTFADGRGFSLAGQLRGHYGYKSELRAIGGAIRDQLFYLKRCGFNAFDLGAESNPEDALASLSDFSETYQAATDQPQPLFRRL